MARQFYSFLKSLIPVIFALLVFPSCSYKYLGPDEPVTLGAQPCIPMNKNEIQFHAFVAIVRAIDGQKWVFSTINQKAYKVVARVRSRKYPTEINVSVDQNGFIKITRTDSNRLGKDHYRSAQRWMASLERSFYKCQCQTLEVLLPEVKKFGIKKQP